jgi:hypothetical protein
VKLLPLVRDVLVLAGAGFITAGAALIYSPAGFIVGGGFLLAVGLIGAMRA